MRREEALRLLRQGGAGVAEWNRRRAQGEVIPDLSYARLQAAELQRANLDDADLTRADLSRADLSRAKLGATLLRQAKLRDANLSRADLSDAFLIGADLTGADLTGANLRWANVRKAVLDGTVIDCNLSETEGLGDTVHRAPSQVSLNSLLCFRDKELPEQFFRRCGVQDEEIEHFRRAAAAPNGHVSCLLLHAKSDESLAHRLRRDIQAAGIQCWNRLLDARRAGSLEQAIGEANGFDGKVVLLAGPAVSGADLYRDAGDWTARGARQPLSGDATSLRSGDVVVLVQGDDADFARWRRLPAAQVVPSPAIGEDRPPDRTDPYGRVRDELIRRLRAR